MLGKKIAEGRTAQIYEYDKDKIAKLYYKEFENLIDTELKYCKIVSDSNISTPKVYDRKQFGGSIGLIMEKIDGICLGDAFGKYPFRIRKLAKQSANIHAGINNTKSTALPCQYEIFKFRIDEVQEISKTDKEKILKYCETLPTADNICHGDLHVENLIYSNSKIYAIDWLTAYKGHPAGDIARTMLIMKSPCITYDMPFFTAVIVKAIVSIYNRTFYNHYKALTGISDSQVRKYLLPIAAIRLSENIPGESKWLHNIIDKELKKYNHSVKHI